MTTVKKNWFFNPPKTPEDTLPNSVKEAIAVVADYLKDRADHSEVFYYGQQNGGVSILPNHFYSPVPTVFELPDGAFEKSEMPQVDRNISQQINLLREFNKYQHEYESYPTSGSEPGRFYYDNNIFVGSDPKLLHSFIRHFKPNKVVEVGSGFSTLLANEALIQNQSGNLIAIEPYPRDFLKDGKLKRMETLLVKKFRMLILKFLKV